MSKPLTFLASSIFSIRSLNVKKLILPPTSGLYSNESKPHVNFEEKRTASGSFTYGAPRGQHDDCVMALTMAWDSLGMQ